ncbi:MAG TPA: IS200/IS605 family transposase [Terriglobales bacterium]|nr:IS200/IS605 family transposase [Terriglobales bacterium]
MPQSFNCNHLHIVFSTKGRANTISEPKRMRSYLGGIASNVNARSLAIGGTKNHVHLLLTIPADLSVARLLNTLKSNSSKWMNERGKNFAWQRGYGSFSVSASNLRAVTRYIETQEEHHEKWSFEQEFLSLLKKHNVRFDPEHVFD